VTTLSPALLLAPSPCHAQFRRVEADPNKEYLVTPDAGAWMIVAAHYSGPNAHELARQMVFHLRSKEGLPAYLFLHVNEEQQRRAEQREKRRQAHPEDDLPPLKVDEFWGVLVGGFPNVDAAHKALGDIKKLSPPELKLSNGATTTDIQFQTVPRADNQGYEIQRAAVNPFANAFVSRNPSTKADAPAKDTAKEDQFLKTLNWGRPYSVFNCKKPWTLVVKDFPGMSVTQGRSASGAFFNAMTLGKVGEVLDANGKQAEEVARVLRESLKLDAYVLHRRYDSILTVGGFDSQNDPALLQMQSQLRNMTLGPIQFYGNPAPMPIPGS
jgi:hypothetical protein